MGRQSATLVVSPVLLLGIAVCLLTNGCQSPKPVPILTEAASSSPGAGEVQQGLKEGLIVAKKPLSAYDRLFTETVLARWHALIKVTPEPGFVAGKVVLRFKLHSDGQVSDFCVVEATVPPAFTIMCEKAVRDPAPFESWPPEQRTTVGADERNITFTFYYHDSSPSRPRTIREAMQQRPKS